MSRRLLLLLTALVPLWTGAPATAQVGPSRKNVRKPAPKKPPEPDTPVVKVRTVPRRKPARRVAAPKPAAVKPPVAPSPVATVKPPTMPPTGMPPATPPAVPPVAPPVAPPKPPPVVVARPNTGDAARRAAEAEAEAARVRLVAAWQTAELNALAGVSRAGESLTPPRLDHVRAPLAPPPPRPAAGPGPVTYRQKVSLTFVREDGVPFDGAQVTWSAVPLTPQVTANRVDLEGNRVAADAPPLSLTLPPGWGFLKPDEARLALGAYPGEESRTELPAPPRPTTAPPSGAPPLFATPEQREMARRSVSAVEPAPAPPAGMYPTPSLPLRRAYTALAEARATLAGLPGSATADQRRRGWLETERAVQWLNAAGSALQETRSALDALTANPLPRQILKGEHRYDPEIVRRLIGLAMARTLQYRAEAEWARAGYEQPADPDRAIAIRVLRDAPAEYARQPELAAQLARYEAVAAGEREYREQVKAGALLPEPPKPVLVTRHYSRTITVHRTEFELRVAEAGLLPGDEVFVVGAPARKVEFRLGDGLWRALVPRAVLKPGDRLRFHRKTETSELEGETVVANLQLYAPAGTLLTPPPLRLVGIRSYSATTPAGEVPLFQELTAAQLRSLRQDGEETVERDGSRWLALRSAPLRLRLRPMGVQVDETKGRREKAPPLTGRAMVDAVVIEGPTGGHVAGVRPGSSARAVEAALGGEVPTSGVAAYVDRGLEIVLQDGIVRQIRINRKLTGE
jgi:hypothetical protein